MSVPGCDNSCLEFRFPLEEAASWEQSVVDRIIPDNDLINLFPLSPEQCLLQGVNEFPVPRSRHSLNNWRGCEQREEKYVIIEILVCNGVMYPWSFLGGRNVAGWMLLTWLNGIAHMYDLIQGKKIRVAEMEHAIRCAHPNSKYYPSHPIHVLEVVTEYVIICICYGLLYLIHYMHIHLKNSLFFSIHRTKHAIIY